MNSDPSLPIAPARVRALVLPVGQIKRDRFSSFVQRLSEEHVVYLRDISADGRPNRNMFSPLAFPDGAIFYDLITHVPPPSHLALSPFDLYREPLAVIAIADGTELESAPFNKRQSANGYAPTMMERNVRALYQELEDLRDTYAKAITHQVLIFDYDAPSNQTIPIPEGIRTIPHVAKSKRTTMKTIICDISSLLLAEMTALAKQFEAMTSIDSPGQARNQTNGYSRAYEDVDPLVRRNSQIAISSVTRSASSSGNLDRREARMSMPVSFASNPFNSSSSTPTARPTTPVKSGLGNPPTTFDEIANGNAKDPASPEQRSTSRPGTAEGYRVNDDRVSVQGFGPGGLNERWRNKGKGRSMVLLGSLYLQAGRWSDALKELTEGATLAKSINDHLWHGKALELITLSLLLLAWAGVEFKIPAICLPTTPEKTPNSTTKGPESEEVKPDQPEYLHTLQSVLPDLLERVNGLYSRVSGEQLPPLPASETTIRFCRILTALHVCEGKLAKPALDMIVLGKTPEASLTTSPRLNIAPNRMQIMNLLFRAFPSQAPELLTTIDRAIILTGIAAVLGTLGFQRKKAMVIRELVSVLIVGLVEARTRGAAEVGIHPAAGLVALNAVNGHTNGAGALELGEGDIEYGVDAFLGILSKVYGVVTYDDKDKDSSSKPADDSDATVLARIYAQSSKRQFGIQNIKLNILRACINFSEALPDFNGVLRFSSDLLRTSGSGIAPGPRREEVAPAIARDEQLRLVTNISKTSALSKRLGLGHLAAEYWDEFLVRGMTLDPLAPTRALVPHAASVLPGAATARTSQDVNPFIYNPFVRQPDKAAVEKTIVTGESTLFRVTLQNPFEIEIEVESIRLDTEGAEFESSVQSTVIGPYRTQVVKISGTPKAPGSLKVTGVIVRIKGCRERRFPIISQPWAAASDTKVKAIGLASLDTAISSAISDPPLKFDQIGLSVIAEQPTLIVESTSLPQSAIMILEGERQSFTVTLRNLSKSTPADLLLFSFQDSTQEPLHMALSKREATPAELYEYELVLAKKQGLKLKKISDSERYIPPGESRVFEFEIFGKPGLTNATIQIDYAHLGVPQSEVKDKFHTRQVCLDLTATVNASVELARMDILSIDGPIPSALWDRLGASSARPEPVSAEHHCLVMMDLRNAWPSNMQVKLSTAEGLAVEEYILPGNTNRVVFPVPRIYLEDPHASIPSLNPSRQRQFVVSSSKITPDMERAAREAFWYREAMLDSLTASWKTLSGPSKEGHVELRSMRLAPRMIEAVKVDEVDIEVSVEQPAESTKSVGRQTILVDEFAQIKIAITNRSSEPIYPHVRLMPALRHRPLNVALDFTRKFAWNGTLQQVLPLLEAKGRTEVLMGVTALCRGEFEFTASVEETQLWSRPETDAKAEAARQRSESQIMLDAVLGSKERRIWHSRHPCIVAVIDAE